MKKLLLYKLLLYILIAALLLMTILLPTHADEPSEPHPGNAMWLEPSIKDLNGKPVGFKFNVTVWLNITDPSPGDYIGAWQFAVAYSKAYLNATRAGYTAGTKSDFFRDITTMPTTPSFGSLNTTHNYILHAESWMMGDMRSPGYGSLSWIEFKIISIPSEYYVGQLLFLMSGVRRCKVISTKDTTKYEVSFTPYHGTYTFGVAPPPTYDVTIAAYCYAEGASVSVSITMDGLPTGFNTTHTFTGLTGTHTFTVPSHDPSDHPFEQWNTGEKSTTITVSSGGTYTAYYEVVSPPVGAAIYVYPPEIVDSRLLPCSTFYINITINNVSDLKICEFNLTFNNVVLIGTSFEVLKVQGRFPRANVILDNDAGFIWVKLNYSTPITTDLPTHIVRIQFHIEALGASSLDLHDTEFLDSVGSPITHQEIDGFFMNLIRDVAVTNVVPSRSLVYQGWPVNITVTVKNKGNVSETFDVKAYYDTNLIGTTTVHDLAPNLSTDLILEWNTTGVLGDNYTIKAEASQVPYEFNTVDNVFIDGKVWVMTLIRDISIIDVVPSRSWVYQGWRVNITTTVKNKGDLNETFTVTLYYDENVMMNFTVENLPPDNQTSVLVTWNTENTSPCKNYTISAKAQILPYELNTTDNVYIDGHLKIRFMGDIDGNDIVDLSDILTTALAFGACPGHPRWNPDADYDQNGIVDISDMLTVALNYGKGFP